MSEETDVVFAVENMFPIRSGATEISGYAPHWDPTKLDVPNVTLDLSHTAASASDAIVMANDVGTRLAHIHLADGTGVSTGPTPTSTWSRPGQAALRRAAARHRRHRLPGHGGGRGQHPARPLQGGPPGRPGGNAGLRQDAPVAGGGSLGLPLGTRRYTREVLLEICNCKQAS